MAARAVSGWANTLTGFGASVFQPLAEMYCEQLATLDRPQLSVADFPWQRFADTEVFRGLLVDAGFEAIEFAEQQLGFHLQAALEW